jgi:acyl dehydratase
LTQKHAVITDEMLDRIRARIGQVWTPEEPFYNTQATRDTIRHFVDGIGDKNPLYRNSEYVKKTRYGRLVAPGCFLYSVYYPIAQGSQMPGIHGLIGGNDWQWFMPILEGDEFTYTVTLTDVVEKEAKISGRVVVGYDVTEYKNQRGQVVARAKGWTLHFGRGDAGQRGTHRHRERAKYTPEELRKINDDYDKEVIRGATPRYWEDVEIGEELPHVVKGPLSQRDLITWNMGAGSRFMRAHGIYVDYQRRHPAVGMVTSATGEVDVPELVHFLDTSAQEIGTSLAYDYGYERISWLGNLLTHWVGDDGFVKRMYAELRGLNYVGDTTWCRGKVTNKYFDENDEPCVDIECWGENQRGEITMPGQATVILPSREKGSSPLDKRLP